MQNPTSENNQLAEQLKSINTALQQLKNDLAQVKGQVSEIHEQIKDLPGGLKWVSEKTA